MNTDLLKIVLMLFVLTTLLSSIAAIMIRYRKYYRLMKENYYTEWQRLMNKDSAIRNAGEWIRWPVGSAQLFFSIFVKSSIDDATIRNYKTRAKTALMIFVVSFIVFLVLAGIMSRLK